MPNLIYYVATSLDGYISGPNEDISRFVQSGDGVDRYLQDLQRFRTTVMGRNTYEFGYRFGLEPGQKAYPHMEHHIFSDSMELPDAAAGVFVHPPRIERVKAILDEADTDVYLCGGGTFAGWLLDHGLIDELHLKLNPIVLGNGVPLFGPSQTAVSLELMSREGYSEGLEILRYQLTK